MCMCYYSREAALCIYMPHVTGCHAAGCIMTQTLLLAHAASHDAGEVGDATCLPQLASALCDAELNEPAAEAMWAVFNRCPDPAVAELMARGTAMLSQGSPLLRHRAALEVFEEACKLAPAFAEVCLWAHSRHGSARQPLVPLHLDEE